MGDFKASRIGSSSSKKELLPNAELESPFESLGDGKDLDTEGGDFANALGGASNASGFLSDEKDAAKEKALSNIENSGAYQELKDKVGEKIAQEYMDKVKEAMENPESLGYAKGDGNNPFGDTSSMGSELSNFLELVSSSIEGLEEGEEKKMKGNLYVPPIGRGLSSSRGKPWLHDTNKTLFERVHHTIRRHYTNSISR